MSLFQMKAPVAFQNANSIQGPNGGYTINGGLTNIDTKDLMYFLALGFLPLEESLLPMVKFINKTVPRILTASHTISPHNLAELLVFDSASDVTLSIPKHSDLPLVAGATINFCSINTGKVTISAASGVSMIYASGLTGVLSGSGKLGFISKLDEGRWLGGGAI